MSRTDFLKFRIQILLVIASLAVTACNNPVSSLFNREMGAPSSEENPEPVVIILEGNDQEPAPVTSESTSPFTAGEGISRANPYPFGKLVSLTGWDIQVTDFLRGENALQILQSTGREVPAIDAGEEYALARINLRCTSMDDQAHSLGISELSMTGSGNRNYGDQLDGWPAPEFLYEDMFTAEMVGGWVDGIIPVDETNLMLVFINPESEERLARFFALEEGASIPFPIELESLAPNDIGTSANTPASVGQKVITTTREVTILGAIRGSEAASMIESNTQYYEPPPADMEYLLLDVEVRNISKNETPDGPGEFFVVDENGNGNTGSGVILYQPAEGFPVLKEWSFPGYKTRGWYALLISTANHPVVLAYSYPDDGDPSTEDEYFNRYFSIE